MNRREVVTVELWEDGIGPITIRLSENNEHKKTLEIELEGVFKNKPSTFDIERTKKLVDYLKVAIREADQLDNPVMAYQSGG